MQELHPGDYAAVLPLIAQRETESHMPLVYALLEGAQAGKVFVDELALPRVALICPVSGFYFAFGDAENPAVSRFVPELLARHRVPKCWLFATSAAWQKALDRLFDRKISRLGFVFQPATPSRRSDERRQLPPGFTMEPMTERVLARWQRGIDPWVIDIWGGPAAFASSSFGCCLLSEGSIVSFAAACGIGGGEAEVEVGTVPEFRRRGLGTLVCQAFIEECAARHLTPTWSCERGNTASIELGKKLGFVECEAICGYALDTGS